MVLVSLPIIYTLVFKSGCIMNLEEDEKIDECYEGKVDAILTTFGFLVGVPVLALGGVWALCWVHEADLVVSGSADNSIRQTKNIQHHLILCL